MAESLPHIRPARPEDVDAATPRIFSSGPDSFRYVFARRCPDEAHAFIADAFIREHTELSYRYHWVAEVDGDVVGTAAGYTGTTAERFLWPIIGRIFRFYGPLIGIQVVRYGLNIEKAIIPPKGPDVFYIANVGVHPAFQGKGIGALLFKHLHAEALKQNATHTALDVSVENPRAEALYTRLGYTVSYELPSEFKNKSGYIPGHRRMEFRMENSRIEN